MSAALAVGGWFSRNPNFCHGLLRSYEGPFRSSLAFSIADRTWRKRGQSPADLSSGNFLILKKTKRFHFAGIFWLSVIIESIQPEQRLDSPGTSRSCLIADCRTLTTEPWLESRANPWPIQRHSMKRGNAKFRRSTGRKPKPKTVNRLFPTLAKVALCFQALVTGDFASLLE